MSLVARTSKNERRTSPLFPKAESPRYSIEAIGCLTD